MPAREGRALPCPLQRRRWRLCHSVTVGKGVTRATIIWIVAAAVVGAVAGVLWVLRSEIGGAHTGTPVVVGSVVLTLVAAALL